MAKKWDKIHAKVKFEPQFIKSHYGVPVFKSTNSQTQFGENAVRICIKCDQMFPLEDCSNCGSDGFVPGLTTDHAAGLFCFKCEKGYSRWTCPNCGTDNPVNNSLATEEAGCFIATAAYGSAATPEVEFLRTIRDRVLLNSKSGKVFVGFYYCVSPCLARFIASNRHLRKMTRSLVLAPIVAIVRRLFTV